MKLDSRKARKNKRVFIRAMMTFFSIVCAVLGIITSLWGLLGEQKPIDPIEQHVFFSNRTLLIGSIMASVTVASTLGVLIITRKQNRDKHLFMSYSAKDEKPASVVMLQLTELLHAEGNMYYLLDRDDIPLGEGVETGVKRIINKADIVVIFVSENYTKDQDCKNEFCYAYESGKRIIPLVLDDSENLAKLPVDLSKVQFLDLSFCENASLPQGEDTAFCKKMERLKTAIVRRMV